MTRWLILLVVVASCIAGCCSPPQARRFVPARTVVRAEPQPTTRREFQEAERQGLLVAATGRGGAVDALDQPTRMDAGEALHVLRVDPDSGEVLACRLEDHKLVRLSPDGLEVEDTTYVEAR